MNRRSSSIDGFAPRRARVGTVSGTDKRPQISSVNHTMHRQVNKPNVRVVSAANSGRPINARRSDIDDSLRSIDENKGSAQKLTRKQRLLMRKQAKKPTSRRRKIINRILIVIGIVILGAIGFLAYKLFVAGSNTLKGNIFSVLTTTKLKEDSNGRSNFLVLGTSEDDPGHDGADLTDSMMVISVDQDKKNVYMFSIPRDLYVDYGEACVSGYSGKINAYFSCSNSGTSSSDEQDRLTKTQKFVGDIFGLDIQYGVHVNQTVLKELVDAVGGVDVDVEGSGGADGVLDRNFDWKCNYTCYYVKYDNGVHHMDGEHALYFSQVRGDTAPTYGLVNSNFDRERNQQKVLIALKDKAVSSGTLTDFTKITKIIDTLGSNLRTNIEGGELHTLVDVMAKTKSSNINRLDFYSGDNQLMTTGTYGGASAVVPAAGQGDYSDIQAYIKKNLTSDEVVKEAAPILVLNGSDTAGLASTKAAKLEDEGFTIYDTDNAPDGTYGKVEIYQIGSGNTATAAKLKKIYGVKIKTSTPPVEVDDSVKFVIIYGAAD